MRGIDRSDDPHNDDIEIEIDGTQGAAGDVTRHIMVSDGGYERIELHSAAHARQLGLALIAAADEVEQMAAG
jgi:hypothetical protein